MKNILVFFGCFCYSFYSLAQSFVPTHNYIKQKVTEGYFTTKASVVWPSDDKCINKQEALGYLNLDPSYLPTDERSPWFSELVPCQNSAVLTAMPAQNVYSACGTYILGTGYPVDIEHFCNRSRITGNPFWDANPTEQSLCGFNCASAMPLAKAGTDTTHRDTTLKNLRTSGLLATTYGGPMNRAGVWANVPTMQWVTFSVKRTLTRSGTYYIGVAADNQFKVSIDGVEIAKYTSSNQGAFEFWFILPVTMTAGTHVITLSAKDDSSPAGVAAEMYDNTEAEIRAATSYSMLNLVFSTKDMIGTTTYMCY
ncbi:MAG: hypothetical protein J7623_11985 [Chitinophaga sp.]|uniref:hypothetical protein n=1 Tax=Chitinophaga sp. TaxID=1869181 RepID=UPI001B1202BC|nr:hypothetical protein [Chitinophaga sp.]MBO9729348.1 hypothetical protein [Chitinophaga sp.]